MFLLHPSKWRVENLGINCSAGWKWPNLYRKQEREVQWRGPASSLASDSSWDNWPLLQICSPCQVQVSRKGGLAPHWSQKSGKKYWWPLAPMKDNQSQEPQPVKDRQCCLSWQKLKQTNPERRGETENNSNKANKKPETPWKQKDIFQAYPLSSGIKGWKDH